MNDNNLKINEKENINDKIKQYINQTDKFNVNGIIMCCFLNNQSLENNNPRLESLKIFIEYGANINEKNPITLWSPIHWVCHYGDIESLKFLLENNAYSFIQERQGYFPLDLIGRQNHKSAAFLLIEYLTDLLYDYERFFYPKYFKKDKDKEFENSDRKDFIY